MNIGLWWNGVLTLISYKPSNQRHAGAVLAGPGIWNKWGLCQHVHCWVHEKECLFICQLKETLTLFFFLSKCLAFTAIFLICYVFPRIAKGILFFLPSAHSIINSSSILLCCLHVRPYLPLNTLSPINIFQISYTVSEYKWGSPCSCRLCVVSSQGRLHSLNFVL